MKKAIKVVSASLVLIFFVFVIYVFSTCPDLSEEKLTQISQTLTVIDSEGNISASLNAGQNRKSISIENIPEHVINALISSEDIRFFSHSGIDIKRILGAAVSDIKSGSLDEGASTVTQQLIKNSHLTSKKSFVRKAHEVLLALELEKQYSKYEILEMYLNYVYFGRGAYGIEAASKAYFGISVTELTVDKGAMLIGLLKAPNRYAPHINAEKAKQRRNSVIEKMCRYGYITEEEKNIYCAEEIVIVEKEEIGDYGYFTDYVLEEGAKALNVSVGDLMGGGYTVYTSLNSGLQQEIQEIFADKENFPNDGVQGAAVVLDNKTGGICAMIGGREHEGMRLYNRANAKRQPGSTVKPIIVYAPAFENGSITASTVLDDYRKDFNGYSPSNFKDKYYGKTTVRDALVRSLNVPAVDVLNGNGIEYSKSVAEKFGITFDNEDNYLAIALGGMKYGITPTELAGAYRTLADGGIYVKPWCIEKICDSDGNTVYKRKETKITAVSEATAYLLTDILCDVSKNNVLKNLECDIACKTGTVGYNGIGYSDAWIASYSSANTVCVWMGYDRTDSENYLTEDVTGSTYPAQIAYKVYKALNTKNSKFIQPDSVKEKIIDAYTLEQYGKTVLATELTAEKYKKREVYFIKNSPTEYSKYWQEPETPENITVEYNELRQAVIEFNIKQEFAEYEIIKKQNGTENKIATLSGQENERVSFTDTDFTEGDEYCILPKHSKIILSGSALTGKKTEYYALH